MFLWRPVLAEPPLCSFTDLDRLSIDDIADMHEALDLREEVQRRAQRRASERRTRR